MIEFDRGRLGEVRMESSTSKDSSRTSKDESEIAKTLAAHLLRMGGEAVRKTLGVVGAIVLLTMWLLTSETALRHLESIPMAVAASFAILSGAGGFHLGLRSHQRRANEALDVLKKLAKGWHEAVQPFEVAEQAALLARVVWFAASLSVGLLWLARGC